MAPKTSRKNGEATVAEITSFRLKRGITPEQAVEAGHDIDAWLRRQPGFVSRTMVARPDGVVTDIVLWRSEQDGRASSERLMAETAASEFHGLVDFASVDWTFASMVIR